MSEKLITVSSKRHSLVEGNLPIVMRLQESILPAEGFYKVPKKLRKSFKNKVRTAVNSERYKNINFGSEGNFTQTVNNKTYGWIFTKNGTHTRVLLSETPR